MKYCTKCGNELFDEAVICPKCGCPVQGGTEAPAGAPSEKRRSHLTTGLILNNIAGILNALIALLFAYLLFFDQGEQGMENTNLTIGSEGITFNPGGLPSIGWYFVWILLVVGLFATGLLIAKGKTGGGRQALGYVYVLLTIAALIVMHLAFPNILYLVMCIWGLVFYVPTILALIAGIKFLQGAK